jgi:two-component system CheB/CheR fusion protein
VALVPRKGAGEIRTRSVVQEEASRILLSKYSPAAVVVDEDLQILEFRGQTGKYLEPAPGDASFNVMKMAREGLLYGLQAAIHEARKGDRTAVKEGLKVRTNRHWSTVDLEVCPFSASSGGRHFLVVFKDTPQRPDEERPGRARKTRHRQGVASEKVEHLQQELAASREYLQSIIQDFEAANEELQSANEEILSSNEELQSTNEELDTAKEELQSTNEELNTLNDELHARNEELSRANSDLLNLLGSVPIALVIVTSDMRIRQYTPMAETVLNLIPSDIGRPISHLKPNIDCPDLESLVSDVIDKVAVVERDVRDRQGNAFSLLIRPYKNTENRIDGAVLALFDVDAKANLSDAKEQLNAVLQVAFNPLLIVDRQLKVVEVNAAFCRFFGVERKDALNKSLSSENHMRWGLLPLRDAVRSMFERGQETYDLEINHSLDGGTPRHLKLTMKKAGGTGRGTARIVVAIAPLEP